MEISESNNIISRDNCLNFFDMIDDCELSARMYIRATIIGNKIRT